VEFFFPFKFLFSQLLQRPEIVGPVDLLSFTHFAINVLGVRERAIMGPKALDSCALQEFTCPWLPEQVQKLLERGCRRIHHLCELNGIVFADGRLPGVGEKWLHWLL